MAPTPNVPGVPPSPPNQPATPNRTIRVSDEVWEAARQAAYDQGETITDVIVRALIRYARDPRHN